MIEFLQVLNAYMEAKGYTYEYGQMLITKASYPYFVGEATITSEDGELMREEGTCTIYGFTRNDALSIDTIAQTIMRELDHYVGHADGRTVMIFASSVLSPSTGEDGLLRRDIGLRWQTYLAKD